MPRVAQLEHLVRGRNEPADPLQVDDGFDDPHEHQLVVASEHVLGSHCREHLAVAVNLLRIGAWLAGVPRAKTRQSAFATLMAGLA